MEIEKLDLTNLFTNLSLYSPVEFTDADSSDLQNIIVEEKRDFQFDCYCIECEKESTFKTPPALRGYGIGDPGSRPPTAAQITKQLNNLSSRAYGINFHCQRSENHVYHFVFKFMDSQIIKIGQYPSIATIQSAGIKKYRSELNSDYQDFAKAVGLFSHGIGAGSFVYLRRIFENLIEEKRLEASENPDWDTDAFRTAKMDDKINLLREYLPPILVENRRLYGIISKGIHELSEEDCLNLFPEVQLAIELILDEKIYLKEKQLKEKKVRGFISKATAQLKKQD